MDDERQNELNEEQPRRQSGLAATSLILGLLSMLASFLILSMELFGPRFAHVMYGRGIDPGLPFTYMFGLSVFGVVSGVIGQVHVRRNPAALKGHWMAVAGIIICCIVIIGSPFLYALTRVRFASPPTNCLNNLKQIGTAIYVYQTDWDDKYPLVSGPGRAFEEAMGQTWNYRTKSNGGERRWMQNVLAPYAKSKRIFWCPELGEDAKWTMGGKHPGVAYYWKNRHGGYTYNAKSSPDVRGKDNPEGLEVLAAPEGSTTDGLLLDNDPLTSYWFNAATTDNSGKKRGTKVISGQSSEVCDNPADAPIVWDTPCGYAAPGRNEADIAHEDLINVLYADGHAKPMQIPNARTEEWTKNHIGNTYGYEGWFPE